MKIKYYDYLLTILKPLIKFLGHIGLPKNKITGKEYFKYRDKINIGGIFLTKTNYEFSNLMNPCKLKHGAIYVGNIKDDEIKYVLESTGKGVILTDLVTFLTTKDHVVYVEYKHSTKTCFSKLTKFVNLVLDIPYDYLFNPDGKAFYCFELCADFTKEIFPNAKLKEKVIIGNKHIYTHETFLDSEVFSVIFDTNEGK
jgi:hypothetical protein